MIVNPLEKLFTWSPEMIDWYASACEFPENDRNRKLAAAVLETLPPYPSICDIGCGIGALSLELAKKAAKVTAVDINLNALEQLRRSASRSGISGIEIIEGDFKALPPPPHFADCVVFCMFGNFDYMEYAERWTDGKVIFITDLADRRCFASKPKRNVKQNVDELRSQLKAAGYRFEESFIRTSFGQPFRNIDDAVNFISCYDRESSRDEIVKMLYDQVVMTGKKDFPIYLPREKEYLLLTISL